MLHLINVLARSILPEKITMANAKILIVEDDTNLLATLQYNLRRENYNVISAIDGAQGSGFRTLQYAFINVARIGGWAYSYRSHAKPSLAACQCI